MVVSLDKLEALFEQATSPLRSSVLQDRSAVLREAKRRHARDPNDRVAMRSVAAALLCNNQPAESLALLQRDPTIADDPLWHRLVAHAHLALNDGQRALDHLQLAIRSDPCQSDDWNLIGHLYAQSNQTDKAIEHFQRSLVIDDVNHEASIALSQLLVDQDRPNDAIDTLRVSILKDRRSATLNRALGQLLEHQALRLRRRRAWRLHRKILEEAVDCYEIVSASAPDAETLVRLAGILRLLDRHDESTAALRKAIEVDPLSAEAYAQLANVHVEKGEMDAAAVLFEKSLRANPNRSGTYFRFTRAKKFKPGDESDQYLAQIRKLLADPTLRRPDLVPLHFAAAKILDDTQQYADAWLHYDAGNRLKPGHSDNRENPQRSQLVQTVKRTIEVFDDAFFDGRVPSPSADRRPIFIIGMPRSGTTLTEQIVSSHPSVMGAGELKEIDRIRQQIVKDHTQYAQNQTPEVPLQELYPAILSTVDGRYLDDLTQRHLDYLRELGGDCQYVTDKMPTNFLHLGLIATLFPGATIIHCRRNPMDVLVSCYCQNLSAPFCDLEALIEYHGLYRRLMRHWQSVLPLPIHTVDYEELVTDPESNVRALIEHCGLPWDARCLDFQSNKRSVQTPSKWQVRQPMYSTSVAKWKRFEPQLREIAERIEEEMRSEATSGS